MQHVLDRCSTKKGEERTIRERIREILDEEGKRKECRTDMESVRRERSTGEGEKRGGGGEE